MKGRSSTTVFQTKINLLTYPYIPIFCAKHYSKYFNFVGAVIPSLHILKLNYKKKKTELQKINLSNLPTYIKEYIISKGVLSQDCNSGSTLQNLSLTDERSKKETKYKLIL